MHFWPCSERPLQRCLHHNGDVHQRRLCSCASPVFRNSRSGCTSCLSDLLESDCGPCSHTWSSELTTTAWPCSERPLQRHLHRDGDVRQRHLCSCAFPHGTRLCPCVLLLLASGRSKLSAFSLMQSATCLRSEVLELTPHRSHAANDPCNGACTATETCINSVCVRASPSCD